MAEGFSFGFGSDEPAAATGKEEKKSKKAKKDRKEKKEKKQGAKVGVSTTNQAQAEPSGEEIDGALKALEKQRQKEKKRQKKESADNSAAKRVRRELHEKSVAKKAANQSVARDPSDVAAAAQAYLVSWKRSRGLWKFNKKTQIWLLRNLYSREVRASPPALMRDSALTGRCSFAAGGGLDIHDPDRIHRAAQGRRPRPDTKGGRAGPLRG